MSAPTNIDFQVNGLTLSGLRWGKGNPNKVLAFHGWLDNCESLNLMATRLQNSSNELLDIIAIDAAGHGFSSHRSLDAGYNIWDDLIDIEALLDQLGWEQVILLGHSRGAIIHFLYAASRPERVRSLFLIDGIFPFLVQNRSLPEQMAAFLLDRKKQLEKSNKVYQKVEQALKKRNESMNLEEAVLLPMIKRATQQTEKGIIWRHDHRLLAASAIRFKKEQMKEFLDALSVPTVLMLAKNGLLTDFNLDKELRDYNIINIVFCEGGHHFHMEPEYVDQAVKLFLEQLD